MLVARTEHVAARPSWDCVLCGQPWPCANAKVDLDAQYARFRTGLLLYLASLLEEAAVDLTGSGATLPADLFDRFLSWVKPESSTP